MRDFIEKYNTIERGDDKSCTKECLLSDVESLRPEGADVTGSFPELQGVQNIATNQEMTLLV